MRRALLALALACTAVPVTAAHATEPANGYAAGVTTRIFVDAARATPANDTYIGAPDRTLVVNLYYPSRGDASDSRHPVSNAKPVTSHRFPLVIFSHGIAGNRTQNQGMLGQWVHAGYVVVAPDFPLSNTGAPGTPTTADAKNQAGDVSFLITKLTHLGGTLGKVIDRRRVGVAGHSLGGTTTLGVGYSACCADKRIRAAIAMSGAPVLVDTKFFDGVHTPLLLIHGDADKTVDVYASRYSYEHANPPKFFVTLLNAPHAPPFWGEDNPAANVVVRTAIDFFDRYLKGEQPALTALDHDANVPGVATLQATP